MIEKIKSELFKAYKKEDKIGLFFSLFNGNNKLLTSNGVIETDKNIDELITILCEGLFKAYNKEVKSIVIDSIHDVKKETDMTKLLQLPTKNYGLFMTSTENKKSGIILPNTAGVNDVKSALALIKKKFSLSGNVEIYSFQSKKVKVEL